MKEWCDYVSFIILHRKLFDKTFPLVSAHLDTRYIRSNIFSKKKKEEKKKAIRCRYQYEYYESNCSNEWSPVIFSYVSRHPFDGKKANLIRHVLRQLHMIMQSSSIAYDRQTPSLETLPPRLFAPTPPICIQHTHIYVLYKWNGKLNGPKRVREEASVVCSKPLLYSPLKAKGIQSIFDINASEWHPHFIHMHNIRNKSLIYCILRSFAIYLVY